MKVKNYFVGLMLLSSAVLGMQAETYYVDANHASANDENAGTSADAPWKTLNVSKWAETGGIINIAPGNYYQTVETLIKGNTELIGSSKGEVVILSMDDEDFAEDRFGNAPLTDRFFTTEAGVNLTVKNLTMKNLRFGNEEGNPDTGGFLNTGDGSVLVVESVDFLNAIVPKGANAVINARGPVSLTDVLIQDCHLEETAAAGDAIVSVVSPGSAKLTMEKVRIFNCSSSGGSIVNILQGGTNKAELYVNNCTFEGNKFQNWGGGIRADIPNAGKLTFHITNSFFKGNQGGGTGVTFIQSNVWEGQPERATKEMDVLFFNNTFIENYKEAGHSSVYASNDDGREWVTGTFSFVNNTLVNNSSNEVGKQGTAFLFVQTPNAEFNLINNLVMTEEGEGLILFSLGGDRETDKLGLGTSTGNLTEHTGGGDNKLLLAVMDEKKGNYFAPEIPGEEEGEMTRQPLSELITFGEIVRPENGNAPFLPVLEGSFNIDKGKEHDLVPAQDARGADIYNGLKDIGAYEYNPDFVPDDGNSFVDMFEKPVVYAYPNPFTDVIKVSKQVKKVEIFQLNGSAIMEATNVSEVNVSALKKGLYLVRLTSLDGNSVTVKMLK